MGSNFWAKAAVWTFFFCLVVQVSSATERSLFQDLGLTTLPDVTKINISQNEYTRMMEAYLDIRQRGLTDSNSIPKLITFDLESREQWPQRARDSTNWLKFSMNHNHSHRTLEIENAQLRILAPPLPILEPTTEVRVEIYQVFGTRRKRLIDEQTLYLSHDSAKWCEFDVTSAVRSWLSGERNLGLVLVCNNCRRTSSLIRPIEAAISALVYSTSSNHDQQQQQQHRRMRRSNSQYQPSRRTDCRETTSKRGGGSNAKRRCCRHNMTVKFAELRFPEMGSIIQPKSYEAGFCQGQCPPNYNHATNHSRIQSLLHQMDRKNGKRLNRKAIPKACCAPSKLEPLEILRVNPADFTKLIVEKWDNMQVIECACS